MPRPAGLLTESWLRALRTWHRAQLAALEELCVAGDLDGPPLLGRACTRVGQRRREEFRKGPAAPPGRTPSESPTKTHWPGEMGASRCTQHPAVEHAHRPLGPRPSGNPKNDLALPQVRGKLGKEYTFLCGNTQQTQPEQGMSPESVPTRALTRACRVVASARLYTAARPLLAISWVSSLGSPSSCRGHIYTGMRSMEHLQQRAGRWQWGGLLQVYDEFLCAARHALLPCRNTAPC